MVEAKRADNQESEEKKSRKVVKKHKVSRLDVYYVIFVLAWALLATIASQYVVALPMALLGVDIEKPFWMLIYYVLVYMITLILVIFVPPRLAEIYQKQHQQKSTKASEQLIKDLRSTPADMGVQHLPTFIDIGLAPIGYIIYMFIAAVATSFMSIFTWFQADQAQDVGFSYFITDLDRVFAMLAIVFLAPVVEELVMRGWLYGKVRSKLGVVVSAILVSLVFALLHGQWNVAVSTFALSLVLCGLREITGTIWSGMLLHILSNGIAFYLVYVAF